MPKSSRGRAALVMATGTAVSRVTGLARTGCIFWVLGTALNADIFENANSIPNALYILLAGGVINVVLVPHMVKNIAQSSDDGQAFTSRIFTLAFAVLGVGTLVALALVPLLVDLVFGPKLSGPGFADQLRAAETLMYLSIPQVFFYGAFVLIGQALNARERFGPMMWAPVLNNVVAIGVFVSYWVVFGAGGGSDGFSRTESLFLGIGSTLGVVVQLAALLPYARSAGVRFRLRFDLRGTGLSPVIKAGVWTLAFVVMNQFVYIETLRLATQGNVGVPAGEGSGSFLFGFGFLVSQMPHGVITVSIVTAALPQLITYALARDTAQFRSLHLSALRQSFALVVPFALLCGMLATPAAQAIAVGAAKGSSSQIAATLIASSLVILSFCIHFVMLRGFYALEDTRTPFIIQCVVSVVFLVSALLLTAQVDRQLIAASLLFAYGLAYACGATVCATLLARRVGPLADGRWLRYLLTITVASTALATSVLGVRWVLPANSPVTSAITITIAAAVGLAVYWLAARALALPALLRHE